MAALPDIGRLARRAKQAWTHDIWQPEPEGAPRSAGARFATLALRSLYIVVWGFQRERIKLRAGLLTYVTLLSLVPAIAVVFSLFTAFGGLRDVEARLKGVVVDALAVNQREQVIEYLDRFVSQISAGKLGTVGTVFLFITVISLLENVERSFNDIWGIRRARSVLHRFQVYWPLATLGPIVLGVSLSMTAAIEANTVVSSTVELFPALGWLFQLGPLVLTCLFFAFFYMVMPNTRVRFRSALVGGFVGGSLWTLAQKLYALYAANAITYSAIYGSLGAIPLFVIWVYVSWTVILLGAALTFAVQSVRTFEPDRPISQAEREHVAVRLMLAVAAHYKGGGGAITEEAILGRVHAPPRLCHRVLEDLVAARLLTEASGEEPAFVPGRPLSTVTLADVVDAMRRGGEAEAEAEARPADDWARLVSGHLERAREATHAALGDDDLERLVDRRAAEKGA